MMEEVVLAYSSCIVLIYDYEQVKIGMICNDFIYFLF